MKRTTILLLIGTLMTSAIAFAEGSTNTIPTSDQTSLTLPPTSFLTDIGVSPAAIQTAQDYLSLSPSEQTIVTNVQNTNLMDRIGSASYYWSIHIDLTNTLANLKNSIANPTSPIEPTSPTEEQYLKDNVSGYTEYTQALNALPPNTQGIVTSLVNTSFPNAVLEMAKIYDSLPTEAQQYALAYPTALATPPTTESPGYAAWSKLGPDVQKSLQSIMDPPPYQTNTSMVTIDNKLQTLNINTPLATKPETVASMVTNSQAAASQAPPTGKLTLKFDETGRHIPPSTPRFDK